MKISVSESGFEVFVDQTRKVAYLYRFSQITLSLESNATYLARSAGNVEINLYEPIFIS